ncbi:hypothetical protein [Mycoplasma putrefaciens]|uniref:Uncharacterized protein n=2 Tax=Mycoplasma putrefaciens TaxID=2123 RepID=M9WCB5_9MOLU|nr:hypothetical protein [Mycoplasma putrefaciens]AEM68745.1 uncharacterized protein MPUT_0368 [Mycoplasma putrefaciens KS1]AGJ90792.1 Hypothetical protein, predicted transmembrane protein [Mycoplasma putrefaciens Mput9231]SYV95977.1 Uncharacterised protein [Mycoplasma putrefaciens]
MKKHFINLLSSLFLFILVIIANESFGYAGDKPLHVLGQHTTPYALAVVGFILTGISLIIPTVLTFSKKARKYEKTLTIINLIITIFAVLLLIIAVPLFIAAENAGKVGPGIGIVVLYLVGITYSSKTHMSIIVDEQNKDQKRQKTNDKQDKIKEEKIETK